MAEQKDKSNPQQLPARGVMSLEDVRNPEDDGYDAPFMTFTWQHWMETQARVHQCFSRFVRAIENQRVDQAIMLGLEVQEIGSKMLLEAYTISAERVRELMTE